jgi:hypothetical protein
VTEPRAKARDAAMARQLWDVSVELTGCDWPVWRVPIRGYTRP